MLNFYHIAFESSLEGRRSAINEAHMDQEASFNVFGTDNESYQRHCIGLLKEVSKSSSLTID